MADWTDGAQYAPVERPEAFVTPRTDSLEGRSRPPHPADGRPAQQPDAFEAPQTVALAELAPSQGPRRDPAEAFTTSSSGAGAWGSAHAWNPMMPLGPVAEESGTELAPDFPPPAGLPTVPVAAPGQQPPLPAPAAVPAASLAQLPPPTGAPVPLPPPASATTPQPPAAPQPVQPDPLSQAPAPVPHAPQAPAPQAPVRRGPFDPAPPGYQPGQESQVQTDQQWQPSTGQGPAQRPQAPVPDRITLPYVVQQVGWLMLAVLAFGAVVPTFSWILLLVASILANRARAGVLLMRQTYSAVIWGLLAMWVVTTFTGNSFGALDSWARVACGLMIPFSLLAGWDDLRRRAGR
ncbi:hypothetical protein [Luteococcus sp.]|uniref:hypothetical protein n=1 Tax=Luteococcus sp. TaxID=1969402 RepID=UPI0037361C1D